MSGQYHVYFAVVWMAALLGAMRPDAARTRWHVPAQWRGALVCWALVIAVGAPIVIWREIDFNPALLGGRPTPDSMLFGSPPFVVSSMRSRHWMAS